MKHYDVGGKEASTFKKYLVITICVNNYLLYNRSPNYTSFYTLGASIAINLALPAKQARHSLTGAGGEGKGGED